ncbi:MAG: hypothetical protein IIT36_05380 [Aeriscardovia sp.]|nr:hypothetical protein [Aeriscardovia sp.]
MRKYYGGWWYVLPIPRRAGVHWILPGGQPIWADVTQPLIASTHPHSGPDPDRLLEEAIADYANEMPHVRLPAIIRPARRCYGYGVNMDVGLLDERTLRLHDLTRGLHFTLCLIGMRILRADVFGYEAACYSTLAGDAWQVQQQWALSWCARWLDAHRRMKNLTNRSRNA